MPKIDKTQYTKEEWHIIRDQRRLDKLKEEIKIEVISPDKIDTPTTFKTAFVLGNGTSRSTIDVNQLSLYGKTYTGVMHFIDHLQPDYLIAVDVKMVLEIKQIRVSTQKYSLDKS